MARTAQQIIEDLKRRTSAPRTKEVKGSYRFDIAGVGSYRIDVDHGTMAVREDARPADCVVACTADDFVRFAEGRANLLTAFMQGRIKVQGDLVLAKALHGMIQGPNHELQGAGA
jgi:putative sterol carrier protein